MWKKVTTILILLYTCCFNLAPVLADEALATYHGQQIMNKGGLRTSLVNVELAGGLLSYLAAPVIAGAAGNLVGNQFD